MNIGSWLDQATKTLSETNALTARLDALVLLEDCLQTDRAHLLAHPEQVLAAEHLKQLKKYISRRAAHEPLAYIRGKSEFYGREFIIDQRVLEPRPESETIIDILIALQLPKQCRIADIGTGSGMLAITSQLELPDSQVSAIDIDANCLDVARLNTEKYNVGVQLIESDLLTYYVHKKADQLPQVLLCNLPYVPDNFRINTAAMHEPIIAIFGGKDGLNHFRKLFQQVSKLAVQPLYILTESLPPQHNELITIAENHGYMQMLEDDFIQLFVPDTGPHQV